MENLMTLALDTNYAIDDWAKQIELKDGILKYWKGGYTPVTQPFALDFATLQDGYVKYGAKGSGDRPEYTLQPAEIKWEPEENALLIADGWQYLMVAKIKSREFGSAVAEFHATRSKALIEALNALYKTFLEHGPEGGVPMVSHQVNDLGDQEFVIHGFITRPPAFGEPINTLPKMNAANPAPASATPTPSPAPAPKAAPGGPGPEPLPKPDDRLLAMLKNRKPKTEPTI
jgi:hypothetical protein